MRRYLHCTRSQCLRALQESDWDRVARPAFAYSLPVHSFHTRRDRVASLTTCRLHGAAIQKSLTTRARPSPDLAVWLE